MPQRGKFKWYQNIRRYRDRKGRFVSEVAVNARVKTLASNYAQALYKESLEMVDSPDLDKFGRWAEGVRRNLKNMHNASTLIALGGRKSAIRFASENKAVWNDSEIALGKQLRYFDNFVLQVLTGEQKLTRAVAARASMYALSGYQAFQNAVRMREAVAGVKEEKRVLGTAEHCQVCIDEAAKGWQPVGTLRRIGDSNCLTRCRCVFKFK